MSEKTASIIGATGLVGSQLLEQLLNDDYFSTVRIIVRRPQPKTNPKMEVKLVDFNDAESLKLALEETGTIFCCIGTTQKKVKGNKELYRKIDFDIPLRTARFAKEAGCEKFIIVSAAGADSHSKNFYLRLKGELEEALESAGLRSLHIMQPGLLLGKRKEKRPAEQAGKVILKILSVLPIHSLKKFHPVQASSIAKTMLLAAKNEEAGTFKYEF